MTIEEWAELEAFVASNWQNARLMDREAVELRHAVVKDLDRDIVLAELVRAVQSGREWPPTPGQLYAAVAAASRPPVPAPGTIIGLLCTAASTFGAERELDALRWLATESEHAARFAIEHGWRQFCREGLHDPEFGGAVRQRLERSIGSCTAGLEREHREGRVLPLVRDHIARLGSDGDDRCGLRRLSPGDLVPERVQVGVGDPGIHREGA